MRIRPSYFAFFEFFPCILTSWVYTDMLCFLSLLHDKNTVQSVQYEAHISRSCLRCLDIRTQVKYLNAWVITLNTAAYHLLSYKKKKNTQRKTNPADPKPEAAASDSLVISLGDYFVRQQNGAPAHNVGSIHQKWREAPKRAIFSKSLDQSPNLNIIDLNTVSIL